MTAEVAPWRALLVRALGINKSEAHSRYFQLATVRADGTPANRTVVFRGFQDGTNQLQIITDQRSQKIEQIDGQPWAEICWYFTKSREQFRLLGLLTIVNHQEQELNRQKARKTMWLSLSDKARAQFAWPTPSAPKTEEGNFLEDLTKPLPNFSLGLFEPKQVDHLQLKVDPQQRYRYTYLGDQNWLTEAVNP